MLPFLEKELVEKKKWITNDEILDYYALGQCTPGIIAVNVSTYIGYKKRGVLGAFASTFGIAFPSVVIIVLISIFLSLINNEYLEKAFYGIRISVCALLTHSIIKFSQKSIISIESVVILIVSLVLLFVFQFKIILLIVLAISYGIISYVIKHRGKTNE